MKKNFREYSDKELISFVRGKKPDSDYAFAEIYDRYGMRINAYINTIMGNREIAEDIFQDTFVKFYQNVKSDYEKGSLIGFLITIARNLCLNAKRDKLSTISLNDIEMPNNEDDGLENKEFSELLAMSLNLLDDEFREPIVLRYLNELAYNDIAGILGITPARARYLVFTGKQKLRSILSPYYNEFKDNK